MVVLPEQNYWVVKISVDRAFGTCGVVGDYVQVFGTERNIRKTKL